MEARTTATTVSNDRAELPTGFASGKGGGTGMTGGTGEGRDAPHLGQTLASAASAAVRSAWQCGHVFEAIVITRSRNLRLYRRTDGVRRILPVFATSKDRVPGSPSPLPSPEGEGTAKSSLPSLMTGWIRRPLSSILPLPRGEGWGEGEGCSCGRAPDPHSMRLFACRPKGRLVLSHSCFQASGFAGVQ
jgi:hypothetical protein